MKPEGLIQRRVFVTGRVQGVGFRMAVVKQSESFPGLRGWVRNLSDGRVEAVFLGPQQSVLKMAEFCSSGPRGALVSKIQVQEEDPDSSLPEFQIEF